MQTTSNATLFQTSYSEALGAYRSKKAIHTSGLVLPSAASASASSSSSASASLEAVRLRYGYPIHLHPRFEEAVIKNADDLAVEGSGADGGRYRVLSLRVDAGYIWTSESGGIVRQIDPETGKTVNTYRGAKAPVPTFDFVTTKAGQRLLVTGSWDKALRIYRVSTAPNNKLTSTPALEVPNAMSDFIKSIHVFTSSNSVYIAAAGSDKSIMLYDASPLLLSTSTLEQVTLKCVHQNKSHTRPVNVVTSLTGLDGTTRLYSADSMGRVLESILNPDTLRLETVREIQGFSTAVYDLKAGWKRVEVEGELPAAVQTEGRNGGGDPFASEVQEDEDGGRFKNVAELWGASGDKSVAGYRLSSFLQPVASSANRGSSSRSTSSSNGGGLMGTQEPLTTPYIKLNHKDFVKSVLPLALHLQPTYPLYDVFSEAVVTAGSDEHVRLFPSPSPPSSSSSFDNDDVHEVEGHWHEITSLAVWTRPPTITTTTTTSASGSILPPAKQPETWIVSAGLDGSVRRWNLASIPTLPQPDVQPIIEEETRSSTTTVGRDWGADSLPPIASKRSLGEDTVVGTANAAKGGGGVQMTAEEEAELAELMMSDED